MTGLHTHGGTDAPECVTCVDVTDVFLDEILQRTDEPDWMGAERHEMRALIMKVRRLENDIAGLRVQVMTANVERDLAHRYAALLQRGSLNQVTF